MGRRPKQEGIKEYLENQRTRFLFSTPADFRECFSEIGEKYLTPATKGKRLGKNTFRVVMHLPNSAHNDRDNYLAKMKANNSWAWRTFLAPNAPIPASRTRWDSNGVGAHFIIHTDKGKRVEFFLTPTSSNPKGTMVNGQIQFPTMVRNWKPLKANTKDKKAKTKADGSKGKWQTSEKLVACPVQVGYFGVSASKPGEFKLTLQKPVTNCPKGLVAAGHAPEAFLRDYEPPMEEEVSEEVVEVKNAEEVTQWGAETYRAFYDAQGYDYDNLLEIQDVEIMDSETEQQAIERAYYDPSAAMVGTDETLDGYRPIDSATVDLTSNQPMANYGAEHGKKRMMCAECGSYDVKEAEGETATYAPSDEPDMVSSSDFDEPTNANFSAEGDGVSVADVEASVEPANEPIAVAEGTSLDGYAPLDSLEEGAPIGHGVNQYFGSAETSFAMEGVEGALLDESTTNITVEEGVSLEGFSGVDSVVVEAPLGHGVTQWFSENYEGPEPEGPSDVPEPADATGSHPSNEYMNAEWLAEGTPRGDFVFKKAKKFPLNTANRRRLAVVYADRLAKQMPNESPKWSKMKWPAVAKKVRSAVASYGAEQFAALGEPDAAYDQGYTDEEDESDTARHGGSATHEQSLKDRRDEAFAMDKKDGGRKYSNVGTMDKFNAVESGRSKDGRFDGRVYVRNDKNGRFMRKGADTAGYLQDGSLSMDGYTPLESVEVDRTSFQPTQNYGAEYEAEEGVLGDKPFFPAVKIGYGLGAGGILLGVSAALAMGLLGTLMGGNDTTE